MKHKKGEVDISHVNIGNMGGCDQSQVKNKKFEKIKSVPKTYQKVITMTAPYYAAQMKRCMQKWDRRDDQGSSSEVINVCRQLVGIIGMGIYHLMADVQLTVKLNCRSDMDFY